MTQKRNVHSEGGSLDRFDVHPEFRQYKIPKVSIESRTGFTHFNYWKVNPDKSVMFGFESAQEGTEARLGDLIPLGGDLYYLQTAIDIPEAVLERVVPIVLDDMKAKGIRILQVLRGDEGIAA